MANVSVRQAGLSDLPALIALFDRYRQFQRQPSSIAAARVFLQSRLANRESFIFTAEEQGHAVGFAQLFPSFSSVSLNRWWGQGRCKALLCSTLLCSSAVAQQAVPAEARRLIQEVHRAAGARDFAKLERLMSPGFVWSFAAEEQDPAGAMKRFEEDPELLRALARVTAKPCRFDGRLVECPRGAGPELRAGFERTAGGWRMTYFLAGE